MRPVKGETVLLGDDGECEVAGVGRIRIEKFVNGEWESGTIENVLLVPRVTRNLFSVGACTNKGFKVEFENGVVEITHGSIVEASGEKQDNGLYRLYFRRPKKHREVNVTAIDFKIWHERLSHIHKRALTELVNQELVDGVILKNVEDFFCEDCQYGKLHKLPFKRESKKTAREPGEVIHSDVCGPIPVQSLGGAKYYVLFKDDATNFRVVYFIRHKSDVYERFKEFERLVNNKFGRTMKTLRTDNGTEYRNEKMNEYMKKRGITLETTAPYTPEQNGKSERDNHTIVEAARTMLQARKLPTHLWAEGTATAVYTLNRTRQSRKGGSRTPYEMWTGKKPDLRHMRVFGSDAYVYVPKQKLTKFDPRAKTLILVGYDSESSNYRCYDPVTKVVSISRHVAFNERESGGRSEIPVSEVELTFPMESEIDKEDYQDAEEGNEVVVGDIAEDEAAGNVRSRQGAASDETVQQVQEVPVPRTLRDRATIKQPKRYELCFVEYNIQKHIMKLYRVQRQLSGRKP